MSIFVDALHAGGQDGPVDRHDLPANAAKKSSQRQQQELLELSTPVIKLWEGVLAVPMIGTLDSSRTQLVMETLLQRIVETGSRLAIIDITGVPTVDTLVAQHLLKTVSAIRLMGAECIISGIRPQIAQTIVHLGIDLQGIATKSTLADALALAMQHRRLRRSRARSLIAADGPHSDSADGRVPAGHHPGGHAGPDGAGAAGRPGRQDSATGAKGVLIDISALEIVDSFVGRMLASISGICAHPGRHHRGGRHAAGRGDHAGGTRPVARRRAHGVERGAGHGVAARGTQGERAWPLNRMLGQLPLRNEGGHRRQPPEGARAHAATEVFAGGPDQDDHRGQRAVAQHAGARRRRRRCAGRLLDEGMRRGLRLHFEDEGPGIPDVKLALTDGWTSGGGMGLGLPGSKRLVNEFELAIRARRRAPA